MGGKLYLSNELGFPNANGVSADDGIVSCASVRTTADNLEATDVVMEDTRAPFEKLPLEVYDQIFSALRAVETPTTAIFQKRNKDLAACLKVSRTLYAVTLPTLLSRVTFPRSPIYSKFLAQIGQYPALGELVRRLDFSELTSIGFGRTAKKICEQQHLTATTFCDASI